MKRPILSLVFAAAAVFGLSSPANGELSISLGTVHLLPDTPGQVVEIYVTGGDDVQGVDLALMTANGGPELEALGELAAGTGVRGPRITNLDLITDTVFAANHSEPQLTIGDNGAYQIALGSVVTASGSVQAEGLLARATLDTTGLFDGRYAFSLTARRIPTDFAGVPVTLVDGVLVVGSELVPAADAGPDQSVAGAVSVRLTGSGVGFAAGQTTYQWTQVNGPGVVLADPYAASTTFNAPGGLSNTDLVFELTVSDGVNTRTDSVTITVNAIESVFSVNAGLDQTVDPNTLVQLHCTVLNRGTGIVSVEWTQVGGPPVGLTGTNMLDVSFVAPGGITNTELVFEVRAYDTSYETADTVTVLVGANPAKLLADAGYDQEVAAGATVQLDGSASENAGLVVTYLWTQLEGASAQLSSNNVVNPTFTAPSLSTANQVKFQLKVMSGDQISIDTVIINVAAKVAGNDTPTDQTSNNDQQSGGNDQPSDSTEQSTTQTQQWTFPALDWTTSTMIAVGIGLLILAFLFLWFFWL